MAIQIGSMYFSVGADTRDYQRGMAQVDATARHVAESASGSLRRIAETATGFLVAQAIPAVINGFKGLASEAFNAVGSYERLSLSLENMAERDLRNAATLERMTVVGQQRVELTAAEAEKLGDLRLQRELYAAKLQEEAERHRQLIAKWGEEGLAVQTHAAQMAQMQERYDDTAAAIGRLEGQQGQYVDIVQRSTEMVLDEAEAKKRSAEIAQELLRWQQQLNINSPFDEEGVQNAMRTAAAYGFVTEQAMAVAVETGKLTQVQADADVTLQRLVQAMVDYSAGTGRTSREVELIALALGQVRAKGKLAGQEVLQLTNAGINVREILAKAFGVTTAELMKMQEEGLIPAEKAVRAIVESMEKDFGGAAKEQTRTWQGLTSTLSDLKKIGLRELFTGTFQAVQPYVAAFVDKLANPAFLARLREIGDAIGDKVAGGLERVQKIVMSFQMGGVPGLLMALGVDFETVKTLETIGDLIEGVFTRVSMAFQEGGLSGALAQARDEFGKFVPGILADMRAKADEWGGQVREWVNGLWANIKDWWATGGGELVTGTIEGIGEWLAGVIRGFGEFSENARGGLIDAIGTLWRGLVDWWQDGGGEIVLGTLDALGKALAEIGAALWDVGQSVAAEIARYASELWGNLVTWWDTGGQQLTIATLVAIGQWFEGVIAQLGEKVVEWGGKLGEWLASVWAKFSEHVSNNQGAWAIDLGDVIGKIIAGVIDFLFIKLPEMVGQFVAWFKSFFGSEGDGSSFLGALFTGIGEFVYGLGQFLVSVLSYAWQAIYENSDTVEAAVMALDNLFDQVKAAYDWVKALPEEGKKLIDGLLSGISAKAGETLSATSKFIADNLKGAVAWASYLWQMGKDLVDGLIKGINDQADRFKQWIVGWAKKVIPEPLWKFFGIASPSLLMMEIGKDLVAGLIAGIQNATPELVQQVSETISSMMGAISSAFGAIAGLGSYASPKLLAEKILLLIGDIKRIAAAFVGLAEYFTGDAGYKLHALRAVMEPLSDIFSGLNTVIQPLLLLARTSLPASAGQTVQATIGLIETYAPRLVAALAGIATGLTRDAMAGIVMLSETLSAAAEGLLTLTDAIAAIASVAGVRIEDAAQRLIWMTHGLLEWLQWLQSEFTETALNDLAEIANSITAALAPWSAAADAVAAIADVAGTSIGTAGEGLIFTMYELMRWVHWLVDYLPDDLLASTAQVAEQIVDALAPWSAVADAVQAIASAAGTRIEDASKRLVWMTHGLITWMNWLIDYLPVGMLEQVSAKADMLVRALAPWRAVADAVDAINDAAGARVLTHEQPAARLMFLTYSLVQWTNWLIEYLNTGVLEQVAAKAEMIVRALSPWRAVANAVKAIDDAAGAGAVSHAGPASKLMFLTYSLIQWTDWLLDYLPIGVLERVAAQAEVLIKALSPWQAIVDAVAALNTKIETAGIPDKANLLAEVAGALALALESIVDDIGRETLEKAAIVGKLLSDVLTPWDKAIKLADAMRTWKLMPDLVDKFSKFAHQWVEIVEDLAKAVAVLSEEGLAAVKAFGETLGAIVNGLAAALDLALALPETWAVPDAWGPFIAWVKTVFLDFYAWVTGWTNGTRPPVPDFDGEQMDLVALVANTIGSLMNGLRAALDLALALPKTWSVNEGAWDTFTAWVRGVFLEFYTWVNTDLLAAIPTEPGGEPGDPNTSMGLVSAFGSALSGLMGGLASALEFALSFPQVGSFPAGEVWENFKGWVMLVFEQFQTWVTETFHPEDPDEFGPVASFGSAMQAVFGGLVSALEFFQGIVGWVGMGSTFQERLTLFLNEIKARFTEIATFVTTQLDADVLAIVGTFGEKLGELATGLSSALDFFVEVADTDPAVYTSSHEFKVRVQALIRTIDETLRAFNEYVVQANTDVWVPAADLLFNAFERMVGLLQDALDLFVDLQASNLPTPNELQTFIGLVIQLFQNLTGAILGAGTGVGTGVTAIEGGLDAGLLALEGYVEDFYDMGRNFAQALADGLADGAAAVSDAAAALGDAAAGATGDALQIASPSRVAMGLGEMFVGGFVNALLAGQANVDAAMRGVFGPQFAPAGMAIDTRKTIVIEFRGQAGGGVQLHHSQFDALKRELIWELQRGA